MCNPILVRTFLEWLSGTEPWPRKPGAVRPSSSCLWCVCLHMYNFAGSIRRTPPPAFSDTAITDPATLIPLFSISEHSECGYHGLLDRKNRSDMCRRWDFVVVVLLLCCCFTSTVNILGHVGTVSLPNHTFSGQA